MATAIVNLENYRQQRAQRPQQESTVNLTPEQLWDYLMRNIKIDVGNSSGNTTREPI